MVHQVYFAQTGYNNGWYSGMVMLIFSIFGVKILYSKNTVGL